MEVEQRKKNENRTMQVVYIVLWMIFTFLWLYVQPLNASPDEEMRYLIPQFIYQYGVLPHGADRAILNGLWGSSYGFNPITSYIISALFMKITALFTTTEGALLISARLVSLLFGAANVWVVMKIAEKIFSEKRVYQWLFIVFATLLPEAVFICSYVNIDAMALFAASLTIYIWILGMESGWKYRHCAALGVSLSLCLLSYYNTYGFLVASFLFFIGCHLMEGRGKLAREWFLPMIKRGLVVLAVVFVCSGWWFIRNYVLYDGDILGMETSDMVAEMFAQPQLRPSNRPTPMRQGMSFFQMLFGEGWLVSTGISFIARFGFGDIYIGKWMYLVIIGLWIYGLAGFVIGIRRRHRKGAEESKRTLFHWMLALSVFLTVGISAYYSYTSDFQPQGRYCLPMLTAFIYFMTTGIRNMNEICCKNGKMEKNVVSCMVILFTVISLLSYFVYFLPNYK